MCYAVIEVKLKNDNQRELKRCESKDALSRAMVQYERMGTVEKVVVFLNHHTHRLTETWVDELYHEPPTEVPNDALRTSSSGPPLPQSPQPAATVSGS